jgi:hypothetical protein
MSSLDDRQVKHDDALFPSRIEVFEIESGAFSFYVAVHGWVYVYLSAL